jgi:hypothetical protein
LFALVAIFRPSLLHNANRVWLRISEYVQWAASSVALAALFYLVFTPVALLLRFLDKDLLRLRREPRAGSYWMVREVVGENDFRSMRNQF